MKSNPLKKWIVAFAEHDSGYAASSTHVVFYASKIAGREAPERPDDFLLQRYSIRSIQ